MHACLVCNEFPPAPHGGTGSSYYDLAHGLVELGHRVTVVGFCKNDVVRTFSQTSPTPNLEVVRLTLLPAWLPHRLRMRLDRRRLKRWLARSHRRSTFNLIESSDYEGWLPFGGPTDVPVVVRIRGSNLFFDHELNRPGDPAEHAAEKDTVCRAQWLGAVSRYAARSTLALCGQPDRACTVLPNAVDTTRFSPSGETPTEPGLIVFVNSINPKKGIEQLIAAMNIVGRSHPTARLMVIGEDTQKPVDGRSYVEHLTGKLEPEFRPRVTFTGRISRNEIVPWLRRAHICCYPSHMETFGIAPIEAMSVGKPVIYSRTGPGPEVLEDGVSGLLCNPYDSADIAAKIMQLLSAPELAARLGAAARARVLAKFNKNDWIGRNVDYYNQCLNTSGPTRP